MSEISNLDFDPDFDIVGQARTTIDAKHRVLVPQKMREKLGKDLILAISSTYCVEVYRRQEWKRIKSEINRNEVINQGTKDFSRLLIGFSEEVDGFDNQGRLLIPSWMTDDAKLTKNVFLLGCGDRLEIWSSEEYAEYLKDTNNYRRERRDQLESAYQKMKGN